MMNLFDIHNGELCRVLWLPGPAKELEGLFSPAEDEPLLMIDNEGNDGVIVKKGGKSYAMSGEIASYVRVERLDFLYI